jgi:hypothetical protein
MTWQPVFSHTDQQAQKWLEENANDLVEKYFGEMAEGGAAGAAHHAAHAEQSG